MTDKAKNIQGVICVINFFIDEDYVATSKAINELMKENWDWGGIEKNGNEWYITLRRDWKVDMTNRNVTPHKQSQRGEG